MWIYLIWNVLNHHLHIALNGLTQFSLLCISRSYHPSSQPSISHSISLHWCGFWCSVRDWIVVFVYSRVALAFAVQLYLHCCEILEILMKTWKNVLKFLRVIFRRPQNIHKKKYYYEDTIHTALSPLCHIMNSWKLVFRLISLLATPPSAPRPFNVNALQLYGDWLVARWLSSNNSRLICACDFPSNVWAWAWYIWDCQMKVRTH